MRKKIVLFVALIIIVILSLSSCVQENSRYNVKSFCLSGIYSDPRGWDMQLTLVSNVECFPDGYKELLYEWGFTRNWDSYFTNYRRLIILPLITHTGGEQPVVSSVVFTVRGVHINIEMESIRSGSFSCGSISCVYLLGTGRTGMVVELSDKGNDHPMAGFEYLEYVVVYRMASNPNSRRVWSTLDGQTCWFCLANNRGADE